VSDFRTWIREFIAREARPVEKFSHQPRLEYDDDVVFAAAWLHDVGVFSGHRPEDPTLLAAWDHVAYAIGLAPSVLRDAGFPEEKIDAVVEAIRTHQPSGDPVSIEGLILRDADILEQLGAVGVLRTVCKIGRDTRFATFSNAVEYLRTSLAVLPGQIRLDSTRRLAQPKIALMEAFLDGVEREG